MSYNSTGNQGRYYSPSYSQWTTGEQNKGYAKRTYSFNDEKQLEVYLNYDKTFNTVNKLNVMAGYSYSEAIAEGFGVGNSHLVMDDFGYNSLGAALTNEYTYSYKNTNKLVSFFGRLNYSFDDRYLLTFTIRDDGSSRFNKDNRWGVFPSAALAWRISQEEFMQSQNLFSNMKLRLGWGKTGQQDINQGDYPYLGTYSYSTNTASSYYRNGKWISLLKPNAFNESLQWETTTTWNAGFDFGMFSRPFDGFRGLVLSRNHRPYQHRGKNSVG